ncbi:MAG: hypothetical protein WBP26_00785 [Candidatus Saccharimonadales bacterium]
MPNANELYPLEQYGLAWFLVGVLCLLLIAAWLGFVFWTTRKKPQKTVHTLLPKEPVKPDINALKAKYLALIAEAEQEVNQHTITARVAHQKLSLLVRYFVFEANGFRAHVMSLSDIKRIDLPSVARVIEQYYPAEFAAIEQGNITQAIAKAKEVVSSWS